MKKNILYIIGIIISFIVSTFPAMAQEGDISQYRSEYVPIQYMPLPEFMVFVDIAIVILIMILGAFFVVKNKNARTVRILTIISLCYLGLIRGGCICPVGVITNVTVGMIDPAFVGLATLVLFLAPLVVALVIGRIFCTSGCPLGAVQQLFYKKKHYKIPDKINTVIKIVPVIMLAATLFMALNYTYFLVCKLEPYKVLFFTGGTWINQLFSFISGSSVEAKLLWAGGFFAWVYLLLVMIVGYWIPRPFCRLLCPYGVLLGVVSIFSFRKRVINKENCIYCGACKKACPVQAIELDKAKEIAKISNYNCVQCNLCSSACKKNAICNK